MERPRFARARSEVASEEWLRRGTIDQGSGEAGGKGIPVLQRETFALLCSQLQRGPLQDGARHCRAGTRERAGKMPALRKCADLKVGQYQGVRKDALRARPDKKEAYDEPCYT